MNFLFFFTALHGMQTRSSDENLSVSPSVCPSVRLSNVCIVTKRKKSCPDFYTIRKSFSLVFWEEDGWWGDPFYLKFWVKRSPLERNRRFWTDIRS